VDVLLDTRGFVALYKDLVTVSVRPGQHLGVGATIGTVGAYEGGGLHFALLNGGREADKYYRSLTSTGQTNKIMVGMFTNPNGPNSPVNCPGVAVNNGGVNPHP
jgi:murein DD-endopeptidase MepM/ murein hydrolase activator NlpD